MPIYYHWYRWRERGKLSFRWGVCVDFLGAALFIVLVKGVGFLLSFRTRHLQEQNSDRNLPREAENGRQENPHP
jgi:hypothetical protein